MQREECSKKMEAKLQHMKIKQQMEKELEEKRKVAEDKFQRRIEERRKAQLETIKKVMIDKEMFQKEEE